MLCLATLVQTVKSAQVGSAYQMDRAHFALSPVLRMQIAQGTRRAPASQMAEAPVSLEMAQVKRAGSEMTAVSQLIVIRGSVWMTARTFIVPKSVKVTMTVLKAQVALMQVRSTCALGSMGLEEKG